MFHLSRKSFDIGIDRQRGALVGLGNGQLEQIARLAEIVGQAADAADDALERGALLAQILGALRIVPDIGTFEFAADFFQTFGLGRVVKETP